MWATAEELGEEALDLATVPRCAPRELAHPKSLVTAPDPAGPMRWARGWSLTGNRPVWVPAVMVWMHIRAKSAAERLTMPISTGCAAHSDIAAALVGAICEVVERDSIALTWLQRIPGRASSWTRSPSGSRRTRSGTAPATCAPASTTRPPTWASRRSTPST
nr:hypothetical protein GCM10020093_088390 [Planobispora longispora]